MRCYTGDGVGRDWFTDKVRESVALLERDFSTKTWGKVQTLEKRQKIQKRRRRERGLDTRKNWCDRWVGARHRMKAEKWKNEETKKEGGVQRKRDKWRNDRDGEVDRKRENMFLFPGFIYFHFWTVRSHVVFYNPSCGISHTTSFLFPRFPHAMCSHSSRFCSPVPFPFLFWRPPLHLPSFFTFPYSFLSSNSFLFPFFIFFSYALVATFFLPSFLRLLIFPLCYCVSSTSFVSSFLSQYSSSSPVFLVPSFFRFFPASPLPPAPRIFPLDLGGDFTKANLLAPVPNAVHIFPYLTMHLIFPLIIFWASWPLKIGSVCCLESTYATTNIRCLLFQKNESLSSKLFLRIMKSHARREKFVNPSENMAKFRRLSRP